MLVERLRSTRWTLLLAASIVTLCACGPGDQSQVSESYKKLPPGEGERRLKETLAKRSGRQPVNPAPSAPGSGPN
ncbi:MAG TPA: hypothetical protein VG944_11430 [Fimbriimonas sp.]|nr:hypothetical protein [Fimbriimonas sp.]